MKILVTGSNGFLGKNLCEILSKKYTVLTFDSFKNFLLNPEDKTYIEKINSCDYLIHAAGLAHTDINSNEHFEINYEGTRILINRLSLSNNLKSFVFISSVSVYGRTYGMDISENMHCKPVCAYGKSKLMAEELVRDHFKKSNTKYVLLRLPLLVGDQPKGNLKSLIKAIKHKRYIQIGSGKAQRSILYVNDIGENFSKIINVNGTYNLTDGENITLHELNDIIKIKTHGYYIKVPQLILKPLFFLGEILHLQKINLSTYNKLTNSLTFSSEKAKKKMNWSPSSAIERFKNEF